MLKKIAFFIVVLGGAALCFLLLRGGPSFERGAIFRLVEAAINASPRLQASRLGTYLDERAGSCFFLQEPARQNPTGTHVGPGVARVPFAQRFSMGIYSDIFSFGRPKGDLVAVVSCRDSVGGEFNIQVRPGALPFTQIDRAVDRPLHLAFFSSDRLHFVGTNLWIILQSPLGDLEVRTTGNVEFDLEFSQDLAGNLSRLTISALKGEVRIARQGPAHSGASAGMIELRAENDGQIRWEKEPKPITSKSPAVIMPSGFYFNPVSAKPAQGG